MKKRHSAIPRIRGELMQIADQVENMPFSIGKTLATEIRLRVQQLYRRPPVTRAPVTSTPITPQVEAAIRAYHNAFPDASYAGNRTPFQLRSSGRISEVLNPGD